MYPRK